MQSSLHDLNKENRSSSRGNGRWVCRDRNKVQTLRSNDDDNKDGDSKKTSAVKSIKLFVPTENRQGEAKVADTVAPLCLNKETYEGHRHYKRDCKKTYAEKRSQPLQQFLAGEPLEETEPTESEGLIAVNLADTVPVFVNGDCHANHAAICDNILVGLAKASIFFSILPLKTPIAMNLAAEGRNESLKLTADLKARITTT